ncbi:MAG TPA: hypothetical protein VJ302_32615, partial [Blastocatellia bacterium]|nr:hypothetical protein [Blastocatellia bacterium]
DHYSEILLFEVSNADVKGLELKAIRGSTIDGVVVIESATDPSAKTMLSKATVGAVSSGGQPDTGESNARVDSEGGFHLTGLAPGMVRFQLWSSKENAISIKRIERNGLELRRAFEIGRGEQVTGIRIVVVQANGTIRGQVEIVGGKLPANWELNIEAAPIRTTAESDDRPIFHSNSNNWAKADEHGRFVIEGMVPGEYELTLTPMVRENRTSSHSTEEIDEITQRVTVNSGAATPVKLTLDLSRKQQEDR